jgi:hypothetical protein
MDDLKHKMQNQFMRTKLNLDNLKNKFSNKVIFAI